MKKTAILLSMYAILLTAGGCVGYFVAGSTLSLVTSGLSAALLCIGVYALFTDNFWGYPFSLVVTTLLFLFFAYRYAKTMAIMPSGMMSVVGLLFLLSTLSAMVKEIKKLREKRSY